MASETFELGGYSPRGIRLDRALKEFAADSHIRPTSLEALGKIKPAFGGVQTGGNSSAIVDGAAATLVASGAYAPRQRQAAAGAARCRRGGRRAAGDHGHRPGAGDQARCWSSPA